MQPNGDTPKAIAEPPALEGIALPRTGSSSRAGILVTKTLVFAGEGWGGGNGIYAYDKKTREILARIALPGAITYLHQGRQYIVVTAGDAERPASLVALALPRE